MLKRRKAKKRQINAETGGRRMHVPVAAVGGRARDLVGAFEERLLWPVADWLRAVADAVGSPLERLAWAVEQRLLWPLQERTAALPAPARTGGAAALAAVALCAVAIGVLSLDDGDSAEKPGGAAVALAPAASPAPAPHEEPEGPRLEGVAPSFGSGGVAAAESSGGEGEEASVESSDVGASDATAPAGGDEEAAAATSSSEKSVPAGPAAMKVARRFSEAFVLYEIGERPARAMTVFTETAAPRLATALAERPPRQPTGTEVPKARVLNLVPGPRRGKSYTVSASLLRVGVTSELRLQMKNQAGKWVVTDVRG
jgi:hypothetical protein